MFFCIVFEHFNQYYFNISDINECKNPALAARCVKNSECCNLPSNFLCKCKAGFTGDGEVHCEDLDECALPGACGENTLCQNTPGNYTCTCQHGFTGDPYTTVSSRRKFYFYFYLCKGFHIFNIATSIQSSWSDYQNTLAKGLTICLCKVVQQ